MRRSRSIRLVLLGATAVTLGACGDEDLAQGEYFPDQASCQRTVSAGDCSIALAEARQRHLTTAPQFGSVADCEREHGVGNCEMVQPPAPVTTGGATTGGGGSGVSRVYYVPAMRGFTYTRGAPLGSMGAPVYQDRTGNAFSGRTRIGEFSAGGSFTSSRRGGFGGLFRSSGS
jgi:uncharacterized protein YgiB involved in biofilm formation